MTVGSESPCRGFRDEVPEQVAVTEVQTVEHADDDEGRAASRGQRIDPVDDLHPASGDRGGRHDRIFGR